MGTKIDFKKIPVSHRRDVKKAVEILKKQGCGDVYLFGSLVEGPVTAQSDIDLAAMGIPAGAFFKIYAELIKYLDHPVDLISLEKDNRFGNMLQKGGYLQRVS
ncbi:MAG TPA: nucleotidyltransferase domain-containing protein [Candidatus Deferrimicrobium sp.]|nr:nucleotidyltransferase domain-containing protein [Candidatus Kapabacteria bacterium]HLP58621.1 nucleotidyltransferase domain-containing protein [Candidatus Deferrimicrobium sp.]